MMNQQEENYGIYKSEHLITESEHERQKIREVIDLYTDDCCLYPDRGCEFRKGGYCVSDEEAYKCLMRRLDGLGVMVRVDRELPKHLRGAQYIHTSDADLEKAGYVAVESLINED